MPFAQPNSNGSADTFIQPAGIDATLVRNADSSDTLTFHTSGEKLIFDTSGRLTSDVDRNGNTLAYAYNADGTLHQMTDTQGRTVGVAYTTQHGRQLISAITDANGPSTRTYTYGYDATTDELTSYTDPNGKVTRYAYTGFNLTQVTDPVGNLTKVTYDTSGRATSIIRVTNVGAGTGPTTSFAYNSGNTVVTDANGHATTYTVNALGLVTSVQDALGHTRSATYNPDNNVLTRTDALTPGNVTNLTYGANNGESLTQLQLPASASGQTRASTSFAYTDATHPFLPSSGADPQGNQLTYAYDTPGNLTTLTNQLASNNQVSATYNANGTVATTTDALGHVTTYTYTFTGGKLTQLVIAPPSPLGATTLHYDGIGRVASAVDGKGQTTSFTYDKLDRTTRITYNGDTACASRNTCTDYGYDDNGNLTSVIDSTGTTSFTYDKQNHQLTKTLPGAGSASVTYTYDGVGNLLTLADAGGTVTYGYDAVNNLTALAEPGGSCTGTVAKCTTFAYDANNLRTTTTYPNGVVMARAYDPAGHLTSIAGTKGGTTLTGFAYTYSQGTTDRALRQTMVTGGVTTSYSYDVVNRLTRANATGADNQYSYDGAGNRLTASLNGTSVFGTPTYNSDNELTALGTTTLGYDGNGNETGRSTGLTALAYNAKDQTTSMTAGGTAVGMTYTGDSQIERLTAGGTGFGYTVLGLSSSTLSGASTYFARDNAGTLVGERIGANSYYYLFDGLGSVVAVTGSAGTALDTYSYDPYGKVTPGGGNSVANPWQYTGGYLDSATGLVKLGQRFYDPSLGRWTQQDPIGSGYLYVNDSPTSSIDSEGLLAICLCLNVSVGFGYGFSGTAGVVIDKNGLHDLFQGGGGLSTPQASVSLQAQVYPTASTAEDLSGISKYASASVGPVAGSVSSDPNGGTFGFGLGPSVGIPNVSAQLGGTDTVILP